MIYVLKHLLKEIIAMLYFSREVKLGSRLID